MIAYASRTGTRRNLAALRKAGWRLMLSPTGVLRTEGFRYALDSGAWTAHQQRQPFDEWAYQLAVKQFAPEADFVVLPDIVSGGNSSLDLSLRWMCWSAHHGAALLLIPVQDGMNPRRVRKYLNRACGIFIGGSTTYKEQSLPMWATIARERGAYLHVGRVNSVRRIRLCALAGADSFDGTSASRYAVTLPKLDAARRYHADQQRLFEVC